MIKVKLGYLESSETVLAKLISQPVLGKPAFKTASAIKVISEQLALFKEQKMKLFEKFGESKEDGTIQVKPENVVEFQKEMVSLLDTDVELATTKLSSDDIDKFTMTPEDALSILWFVEDYS